MKAVILAGGLGSRLSEETIIKPKPMVEIGGRPILWHIMKIYAANGITDFIVCLGYKGYVIKEYFANYFLHSANVVFDLKNNSMEILDHSSEPWKVCLIDTGLETNTGGRLKQAIEYIDDDELFCMTYGDGVADININSLINIHKEKGKIATVTAVQQPGRFGSVQIENNQVQGFFEKPHGDGSWINGGFFVLSKKINQYIDDDSTIWEREPLEKLVADKQLAAYMHEGFWQPMDTLREKNYLESLWQSGQAPWKLW